MTTPKLIRSVLLDLNIKAEPHNVYYILQYDYQYSSKYQCILSKISVRKYENNEMINKIKIKGGKISLIEYLSNELKQYN